jgi:ubiquinone/menaquinone biosynthesis C-methylase UbiE
MSTRETFDEWAADGRDREMEAHHWHTAKEALAFMPVEDGDAVLDVGTGSGYALRALADTHDLARAVGLDGSPVMVARARENTDAPKVAYTAGDFHDLPFAADSFDHV